VPGDKEAAEITITFLENRRLLFGDRHAEDEMHCVQSANEIRHFLTAQIGAAHSKDLVESFRAMRAACRRFVEAGGPYARNFHVRPGWPDNIFGLALADLRTLVGVQIARIAKQYDLSVEADLAAILPPPDEENLSWIPGFDRQ
jgi:hypothetical protein